LDSDLLQQLPNAPRWALLAGQAGSTFVLGSIAFFVIAIILWVLQAKKPGLAKLAAVSFFTGCLSVLGTMACLVSLFVTNQFEYEYVITHGDAKTSLSYKIAGVWTAQQGSFLLWACGSALFAMLAFRGAGMFRRWYAIAFSAFLASLSGILAYDTPFNLMKGLTLNGVVKLPHDGTGMTPALQNYWVIIHPPTIFMGFGSLMVLFALSMSAMLTGNAVDWIKIVRPWALVSASILGLGLCMGGMWAYETQGWGGFWAWDPVENVSFVPWLFTVGLIHGIIVQTTKKRWIGTNLFLGGLPFLTFVYGTFLTRSGLLDKVSIHSFAEMNHVALIVLEVFLGVAAVAFFATYGFFGRKLAKQSTSDPDAPGIDREGAYRAGVLLLSLMATGIAIGMSWPWWSALKSGTGFAIEEKQYHLVIVWFFIPVMLLMGIAPFIGWAKISAKEIFNKLVSVLSVAAGVTGLAMYVIQNPTHGVHAIPGAQVAMPFGMHMPLKPWMAVLLYVCVFTATANIWRIVEMFKRSKLGIGGFVAHIGLAILMTGLVISRGFEQKDSGVVSQIAPPARILGYQIAFKKLDQKSPTLDDRNGKVIFSVDGPDGQKFDATPGLYYYPGEDGAPTAMVWPYVKKYFAHDFYMAMNKPVIEAWQKPLDFTEGQTRVIKAPADDDSGEGDMTVTYKKFVMNGSPGQAGTTFGAQLTIGVSGQKFDVTPTMSISDGSPERDIPAVGRTYRMAMLSIDPATKAVKLQLMFAAPLYPIVLFYKPMTILVWAGTGIMTLGGLISAFYRRARKTTA
jgi:cytochrome c-type biogenesis protein CcmF